MTGEKRDKKKDLEILGLSGIFQGIADNKRSGILYVQSGNQEKYVYFRNGNIKMISSPNSPSVLAEGMRRAFGQIDDATLEAVFQAQGETGKSLSEILLEMDANQEFIEGLCRFQIGEEIYELFIWPQVQFEFSEKEPPEGLFREDLLALNIEINPGMLLMEAARRIDIWQSIYEKFPDVKDVPYIAADIYEDQLSPEEIHLLSLLDKGYDFEEILAVCRLPQMQAMQTFHSMHDKGYIRLKTGSELKEMANFEEYRENIFKCIKLYERAEELGERDITSLSWLAEAYEASGLISKAVVKYKELGEACREKEDLPGSIEAYSRVINYAAEDFEAHEKYVTALFQNGQFQEGAQSSIVYAKKLAVVDKKKGIQVLEDAYQHNPLSPEVLEYMATLYFELGEHIDAIFTYTTLANLYKSRGIFEETVKSYKKILAIDNENIEARIELANTYLLMGNHEEGVAEYKKLGDILRLSGLIQDSFGFNYLINVCEKIIEFEPTNLSAREWLADVYIYRREMGKAKTLLIGLLEYLQKEEKPEGLVSILQKLVQIEPYNRNYHRLLAETYHAIECDEEATKELICIGDLAIEEGSKFLQEGKNEEGYRSFLESLEALNAVLIIEPFNLEVRQKRAELLHQLGQMEQAVEEYKLVCNMTKAINNYHDALTALFHIVELAPDNEPQAFLELGKLCERQNKIDLAVNFYKKYARRSLLRGDFGEVLQVCRRLINLDPSDAEAQSWNNIAMDISRN